MSYTIRRMRAEDIPQVVEIEKIAFTRPWTKSIFKAVLLLPYAAYYVAVEDEEERVNEDGHINEDWDADTADRADGNMSSGNASERDTAEPADHCEKIVGVCGVKKIFEEGDISNVAVLPEYRGRGISRKMLDLLMREAREDGVQAFTLEVRAGNAVAVNLYESLGFRTEGVRPRFYDDPVEDALIMWQRPQTEAAE